MSSYRADYEFTLMADEVHPNPEGNNVMAGIIDDYMKKYGLITQRLK
jgi:lysophospholipase L1-like esterase